MINTYNDNAVVQCALDRSNWREAILRQIIHSPPPKVLGLHGTWGSGKTSIMAQMYTELGGDHIFEPEWSKNKKDKKRARSEYKKSFYDRYKINFDAVQPIWFEAWQYQHETNILAALLKEIRDQLSLPHRIWDKLTEETLVATTSLLQSVSFKFNAFGANFGVANPEKLAKINSRELQERKLNETLDTVLQKKLIKEAIDQLLSLNLPNNGLVKKAVIFIDDLDRCLPETAFRILESIKVYLNLENCIFVLGMDIKGVEEILSTYYQKRLGEGKNKGEIQERARHYMEKICQDVYHLPVLTRKQRWEYLKTLISQKARFSKKFLLHFKENVWEQRLIQLPAHPRTIKIFANVILYHLDREETKQLAKSSWDEMNAFICMCYLYTFHFDIYRLCLSYDEYYDQYLLAFCDNPVESVSNQNVHSSLIDLKIPKLKGENQDHVHAYSEVFVDHPDLAYRKVLWIRGLIKELGRIDPRVIKCFRN